VEERERVLSNATVEQPHVINHNIEYRVVLSCQVTIAMRRPDWFGEEGHFEFASVQHGFLSFAPRSVTSANNAWLGQTKKRKLRCCCPCQHITRLAHHYHGNVKTTDTSPAQKDAQCTILSDKIVNLPVHGPPSQVPTKSFRIDSHRLEKDETV